MHLEDGGSPWRRVFWGVDQSTETRFGNRGSRGMGDRKVQRLPLPSQPMGLKRFHFETHSSTICPSWQMASLLSRLKLWQPQADWWIVVWCLADQSRTSPMFLYRGCKSRPWYFLSRWEYKNRIWKKKGGGGKRQTLKRISTWRGHGSFPA